MVEEGRTSKLVGFQEDPDTGHETYPKFNLNSYDYKVLTPTKALVGVLISFSFVRRIKKDL